MTLLYFCKGLTSLTKGKIRMVCTHTCNRTDSRVCLAAHTAIEIPIRDLLIDDSFIFLDDDDENHVLTVKSEQKQHARDTWRGFSRLAICIS